MTEIVRRPPASFGVMFHHFHGQSHPKGQGAISPETLERLIAQLAADYQILSPGDYTERVMSRGLADGDICLTFDDALKCQMDLALPVLESLNLKGYFFAYSSAFDEKPEMLEIYRYFRTTKFEDFDEFFELFLGIAGEVRPAIMDSLQSSEATNFLRDYPFYTANDKRFRYLRDTVLRATEYEDIHSRMMTLKDFDPEKARKEVFMSEQDLVVLNQLGHEVGLHSHTHPTRMDLIAADEAMVEYSTNQEMRVRLLGNPATSMSHPCGRYNADVLQILSKIGIHVGFLSSMATPPLATALEIPRLDHTLALHQFGLVDA